MRFLTTLLLLGALALGQTNEEDDIREAVFRHQFEHNASGQKQNANAYYLCGPGKNRDLPADFMKRFATHKPPVRICSASHYDPNYGLVDNKTGRTGLSFHLGDVKWTSDSEVEVQGGYYEGNMSSSNNTYSVRKQNGKWVVTQDVMNTIASRYPSRNAAAGSMRAARRAGM